jgi:hypothetical protein
VYIDTGSPVPNIPSKSHGLADENKKFLTEWKIQMIRNKRITGCINIVSQRNFKNGSTKFLRSSQKFFARIVLLHSC